MKKLWRFCKDIYDPGVHLYFAANWYFALYGILGINHHAEYILSLSPLNVILSMFLILLYLRIVDEIKDFDYDKMFNPDRPLVKGSVTKKELHLYLLATVVVTVILNYRFGISVLLLLLLEFIYGYSLILIEKRNKTIREDMMINLLVTYPVNILISFYIFLVFTVEQNIHFAKHIPWTKVDAFILIAFATCFLYYEFARKISWPSKAAEGQRLYSSVLGFWPSIGMAMTTGLAAMVFLFLAVKNWSPALLLIPLGYGLWRIQREKIGGKTRRPLTLSGSLFLGFFYGITIVLSVLDFYMGFDFNRAVGP